MLYIHKDINKKIINGNFETKEGFSILFYDHDTKDLYIKDDDESITRLTNNGMIETIIEHCDPNSGSEDFINLRSSNGYYDTSHSDITIFLPDLKKRPHLVNGILSEYKIINIATDKVQGEDYTVKVYNEDYIPFRTGEEYVEIKQYETIEFMLINLQDSYYWLIKKENVSEWLCADW